jgi:hypothetical protein
MRAHITHIIKEYFFPAFYAAFQAVLKETNIKTGCFRGAGFIPFDPESVISKLDAKCKTPTTVGFPLLEPQPWVSKTPQNPTEAISQSEFVKNRIARHQNSSPTSIYGVY